MLRLLLLVAFAVILLVALFRWAAGGRKKDQDTGPGPLRAGAKHSAELRCETHGLTVRLEADGAEEFERSRIHLRCPLCGMTKS